MGEKISKYFCIEILSKYNRKKIKAEKIFLGTIKTFLMPIISLTARKLHQQQRERERERERERRIFDIYLHCYLRQRNSVIFGKLQQIHD